MMMNDDKLTLEDELLLQAYLDGELTPDQRQVFAARLEREPGLTAVLHQWRALLAELPTLPEPQLTRDLTAGVLTRLDPMAALPTRSWRPLLSAQFALALLTTLLAWPLWKPLAATWWASQPALPDWAALAQTWTARWAVLWTPDVWLTGWTAVWQGAVQIVPFSLSLLLPLAVVTAVLWLASVRFVWRTARIG
ncbi:MAG: hypothetical protein IPH82_27920 [Chloroflexi bacterium]|nr:hypothetical protein [Chloroflexota bacterium]MBK8934910.1 hypothetical protein [Chloroflexota bacterium]